MRTPSPEIIKELAPTGALRVAINFGNPVLAQRAPGSGEPQGVSADLAREIGRLVGVPLQIATFDAAGKVFDAAVSGVIDLMFLAIDPVRSAELLFTAPYVLIEGTYLVRQDSAFHAIEALDRANVRIAVGKGAAYDLFLTRALKQAALVRSDTSAGAVDLFVAEGLDAAAGVRQPLQAYAAAHPGFRVIDGRFTAIEQAIAVPKGRDASRAWLHDFIEERKADGSVARSLDRSGQSEAGIAPAQGGWP